MNRSTGLKIVLLLVIGTIILWGQNYPLVAVNSHSAYAYIHFDIQPPETNMTVDGNAVYHQDNVLKLSPGDHKISLRSPGYNDMEFHVDLVKGDTLSRKIFLLPFSGDLRLNVPNGDVGCEIYRDGKQLTSFKGSGGLNNAKIGEYVIRVSDGVNTLTDTIMIYRDKMLQRTYTRRNLIDGYVEKQRIGPAKITTKSICLDLSGAYSVYDVQQNNILGEINITREVESRGDRLNYGVKAHYYSPYVYDDPEGIIWSQDVSDHVLLGGFVSWQSIIPRSFLGLGYEVFGGIKYDFKSMNYEPFYDIPLFYFCPALVLGDTLINLRLRPYVRHLGENCLNRCDLTVNLALNSCISVYVKGDCHIPAEYIPDDVRVYAGMRFNFFSKQKTFENDLKGKIHIQPAVKHVVCNDGFWSQGSGMGLFVAYAATGGFRAGVDALICTACMNADFNYLYQGSVRMDLPIMLTSKHAITPSLQCGMSNHYYAGDLYLGAFAAAGLYYEHHFRDDHMITAGVSLPLKFSEISDISNIRINTIILSLGIGINA